MSKKRAKTPSTSKKLARKLEAPKLLSRDAIEAEPVVAEALPEAMIEAMVEPMLDARPMVETLIVEAPMLVETVLPTMPALPEVDRKQIARLAFSKFVARGYVHGYHIEDWLAAEAELRARA